MKQAKIALTAVAILAVVGSAVAFKANRILHTYYKTNPTNGFCSLATQIRADVTTSVVPGAFTTRLATAPLKTACPQITVKAGV